MYLSGIRCAHLSTHTKCGICNMTSFELSDLPFITGGKERMSKNEFEISHFLCDRKFKELFLPFHFYYETGCVRNEY